MNKVRWLFVIGIAVTWIACQGTQETYKDPREVHLRNLKRLTHGGSNAEAYFSPDGRLITFQSNMDSLPCDQIFLMDTTGKVLRMVSTGKGRTSCSFFLGPDKIIFASTHDTMGPECPENPLVWKIILPRLTRKRRSGALAATNTAGCQSLQALRTNSDLSPMAPMPGIRQSMS